ncbi:multidrug transporter EmrE-like cation transporter [Bradyrhizobium sp. USDA 4506]
MAWTILFTAGLLEIGWAIGLKYTEGFSRLVPSVLTLAAMAGSVILLGLALKTLPIGTAYAVWTGRSARSAPRRSASSCSANPRPRCGLPASD